MDDLFRFVILRPANPAAAPAQTLQAQEDLVRELDAVALDRRSSAARTWLEKNGPQQRKWRYLDNAAALATKAAQQPDGDLAAAVNELFGADANEIVADRDFRDEQVALGSIVTAAALSGPTTQVDLVQVTRSAVGFDLVDRAAAGEKSSTIHLLLPGGVTRPIGPAPNGRVERGAPQPPAAQNGRQLPQRAERLASLARLVASAPFVAQVQPAKPANGAQGDRAAAQRAHMSVSTGGRSVTVGETLAEELRAQLRLNDVPGLTPYANDLADLPRASVVQALSAARLGELGQLATLDSASTAQDAFLLNGVRIPSVIAEGPHVAPTPLPITEGLLRPVGVGDLMLVREHVKGYEAGEIAHIENILRSEKLDRKTRRFERTEETVDITTETTKEEERDTQTTDRFSLKREASDTVKTDTQLKGELSVDAKYGPMVEVKADVSASTQTQTESSTKTATEFSKEVVSRSVSKVSEKIRREVITKTINEFEEWYEHGFDNSAADAKNIAGVYQWIDKISEAQVMNYGKRLLFDCVVPEPARFYIWAQGNSTTASITVKDPGPFTLKPEDINEGNYQDKGIAYGATDLEPPPLEWLSASKAYDMVSDADPHAITKSDTIPLPDGYVAQWADYVFSYTYHQEDNVAFDVQIGRSGDDVNGLTGAVPVSVHAYQVFAFALNVMIQCQRTDELLQQWREKVTSSIYTAWLKLKQDYDQAVAAANAQASATISGRNPETNKQFVLAELRKACIAELTGQEFDAFGAISVGSDGLPQLDLAAADEQGKYIRFFEEAFEWEHIAYYFFPYYWGEKSGWKHTSLFDDTDPDFGAFLRAGAARVVFPVRPGFEKAIVYYLSTGLIWNGGDPPDISSSDYVPIVEEIEESLQHPGDEVAVGDPWEVRTPTTLVKLRADDALPEWQKQGDKWVPAN